MWLQGWQCQSVSPPLWSWMTTVIGWIAMKYCTESHDPQKTNPTDIGDPLMPPAGWQTNVFTFLKWNAIKFYRHSCPLHYELNFGDPLTSHLAPPPGQHFSVFNTLVHEQIRAKLRLWNKGTCDVWKLLFYANMLISKCQHANTLNLVELGKHNTC